MAEPTKPKRDLFRLESNVYIGSNCFPFITENPIEAAHYFARGFHDCADMLIEAHKKESFPDYTALPIVFLYRHAAELYIKSIIWNGDELLKFLKKPTSNASGAEFKSHSLTKLLPFSMFVMEAFGLKWNDAKRGPQSDAAAHLAELDRLDPGSFSFRYPVTKKGAASLPPEFGFNILAFAEPMKNVLEGLWELSLDIEGLREHHTFVD